MYTKKARFPRNAQIVLTNGQMLLDRRKGESGLLASRGYSSEFLFNLLLIFLAIPHLPTSQNLYVLIHHDASFSGSK
jgi:hypothetical protein